jgi:hypothetical protein
MQTKPNSTGFNNPSAKLIQQGFKLIRVLRRGVSDRKNILERYRDYTSRSSRSRCPVFVSSSRSDSITITARVVPSEPRVPNLWIRWVVIYRSYRHAVFVAFRYWMDARAGDSR